MVGIRAAPEKKPPPDLFHHPRACRGRVDGWLTGQGLQSLKPLAPSSSASSASKGRLRFDPRKPDGTPRKLLDTSRLAALGWQPRIRLADGLADAYRACLATLG
jgi:nucleoside-diphosphate-sugar epimerase